MTEDLILRLPFFTDDHRDFVRGVDAFMRKEAPLSFAYELEQHGGYPEEAISKMAKAGLLQACVPTEYGGLGLGYLYHALMVETMSRHCDALAVSYSIITWGIHNLIKYGTEEQKAHYLPRALAGKAKFAAGITEPNAGSDAASLSFKAERQGDEYVLNGQKVFMSARTARVPRSFSSPAPTLQGRSIRGITAFLVPNNLPGIEMRWQKVLAGNAPGTNEVFFY